MSIDIKQIEKNYALKEDFEIERIATSKSQGLRPEVYQIIENEIRKRNLNPNLLKGLTSQNKVYSFDEINNLAEYLRSITCPVCKSKTQKLNGTRVYTIKSFILFSYEETKSCVACPNCLDKKNNNAMLVSLLLGWWGIPSGILKTPFYIFRNYNSKKENHSKTANNALLNFVSNNIGYIESFKDDMNKLSNIMVQ